VEIAGLFYACDFLLSYSATRFISFNYTHSLKYFFTRVMLMFNSQLTYPGQAIDLTDDLDKFTPVFPLKWRHGRFDPITSITNTLPMQQVLALSELVVDKRNAFWQQLAVELDLLGLDGGVQMRMNTLLSQYNHTYRTFPRQPLQQYFEYLYEDEKKEKIALKVNQALLKQYQHYARIKNATYSLLSHRMGQYLQKRYRALQAAEESVYHRDNDSDTDTHEAFVDDESVTLTQIKKLCQLYQAYAPYQQYLVASMQDIFCFQQQLEKCIEQPLQQDLKSIYRQLASKRLPMATQNLLRHYREYCQRWLSYVKQERQHLAHTLLLHLQVGAKQGDILTGNAVVDWQQQLTQADTEFGIKLFKDKIPAPLTLPMSRTPLRLTDITHFILRHGHTEDKNTLRTLLARLSLSEQQAQRSLPGQILLNLYEVDSAMHIHRINHTDDADNYQANNKNIHAFPENIVLAPQVLDNQHQAIAATSLWPHWGRQRRFNFLIDCATPTLGWNHAVTQLSKQLIQFQQTKNTDLLQDWQQYEQRLVRCQLQWQVLIKQHRPKGRLAIYGYQRHSHAFFTQAREYMQTQQAGLSIYREPLFNQLQQRLCLAKQSLLFPQSSNNVLLDKNDTQQIAKLLRFYRAHQNMLRIDKKILDDLDSALLDYCTLRSMVSEYMTLLENTHDSDENTFQLSKFIDAILQVPINTSAELNTNTKSIDLYYSADDRYFVRQQLHTLQPWLSPQQQVQCREAIARLQAITSSLAPNTIPLPKPVPMPALPAASISTPIPTPTPTPTPTIPTHHSIQTIPTDHLKSQQARTWGLTGEQWQRYQQLMQGEAGHWYPQLNPIEVLGIYAKTEQEQREYAELVVQQKHLREQREWRFSNMIDSIVSKHYQNLPLVKPFDSTPFQTITPKLPQFQKNDQVVILAPATLDINSTLNQLLKALNNIQGTKLHIIVTSANANDSNNNKNNKQILNLNTWIQRHSAIDSKQQNIPITLSQRVPAQYQRLLKDNHTKNNHAAYAQILLQRGTQLSDITQAFL
jgi:integrating conjugative element protein (TIGR03759 family)